MRFLENEIQTCQKFLPGCYEQLAGTPLTELEAEDGPAIVVFREHGGTNLLVPAAFGGLDADPVDAARVVTALGSVAPSMTVATMMHHFSVGTLFALAEIVGEGNGLDDLLLRRVATERILVASGFAEGKSGQNIFSPTMSARAVDGGYLVSGSKKPCSLANSMGLLTASVAVPIGDDETAMGLLMLPADTPGVTIHRFWKNPVLAAAESHEVRLTDVFVRPSHIIQPDPALAQELDQLQTVGLIWFQMMVSASYTGMAAALAARVLDQGRGSTSDRASLLGRIGSASLLTEGLARRIRDGEVDGDGLAAALTTRYAVQDLVRATADQAVELLGGMAFIGSREISGLSAACHAIAFHPPARTAAGPALVEHAAGRPLLVG
ncbi:acyl-CoA dehydrogenase family protein [Actinocorallia lasiicapitis]